MTLHLDFTENANQQQLLQLGEWLKAIGLIKSYKILPQSVKDTETGEADTNSFISSMLEEAEEDIAQGRVYTTEEAKTVAEKWLKELK